ncbi:uncharacterized protein LOC126838703 [Adelges cooleyi]|uniref:uncharacterized protein LOC126838703 n=1 Tax=Adelges cooleyi TaxID=133065 RepID=UPI00217F57F6|nr:uncharacterized protein LOC126838703 [Adelges cooleyi]
MKLPIVYLIVLMTMAVVLTKAGILTHIHNIIHHTTTQKATNNATTPLPSVASVQKSSQPPTLKSPELNGRIGYAKEPDTKGQSQPQKPLEVNHTAGDFKVETTTNHRSIINVPVKSCPEGQAMTPDRECRTVYDLGDR